MRDSDLRALLGEFYDDTSLDQRAAISAASERIGERWPDPDLKDTRREALNAAMEVVFGDATAEEVAAAWRRARAVERDAHARLTGAIIASALIAPEPEARQAERLGITRMTLRKALGR